MTFIRVAAVTHRGLVRSGNEDSYGATALLASQLDGAVVTAEVGNEPFLAVVADGLGGLPCGEVASALAVERLLYAKPADPASLMRAIQDVDRHISHDAQASENCRGMATTVVAVLVYGERLAVVNVGDSPALEYVDGRLVQLTVDDVPSGRLSLPGLRSSRLTQAVGGRLPPAVPHLYSDEVAGKRRLLLCTDGLTNFVSSRDIAEAFASGPTDAAVVSTLVKHALAAGGEDNITCMAIELA